MYLFFTPINYLYVDDVKNHQINNSSKILYEYFDLIKEFYGQHAKDILSDKLIYYNFFDDNENLVSDETSRINIHDNFRNLYSFSLWIIKDNSIYNGHSYIFNLNKGYTHGLINSSSIGNSKGEYSYTYYSAEELDEALNYHDKLTNLLGKSKVETFPQPKIYDHDVIRPAIFLNYNDFNRLYRSMNFITNARYTLSIIEKISWYVVGLEALFGNDDKGEIKFKIQLRTAHFLGQNSLEKTEIKNLVGIAYDLRSSFLHGSSISKKFLNREEQAKISNDIDNYLRKIFQTILNNSELSEIFFDKEKFIQFFDKKIY